MHVDTALALINGGLTYPPDVVIEASDYTHRYEATVRVSITLPHARRSERALASAGYPVEVPGGAVAHFTLRVDDCADAAELALRILDLLATVRSHEDREMVRLRETGWAPAHPHRSDGIDRWARHAGTDPHLDYYYGTA